MTTEERKYYAHSFENKPESDWQPLGDHLKSVAELSAKFAGEFGCADWGYLAGRWHDLGKFSNTFQRRLAGAPEHVDHSTAGAQHAVKGTIDQQAGKLLAYILAGHHGGLPNGSSAAGSDLHSRLSKTVEDYSAAPYDLLDGGFKLQKPPWLNDTRCRYQIAFLVRMLFSCLVDADFIDTEAFMKSGKATKRGCFPNLGEMEDRLSQTLKNIQAAAPSTRVNAARKIVLQSCLRAAELPPGIFSLTVPTGGGKTLSSLAFALRHARTHSLNRVIYALPFTSIIEQNADVFREALCDCADAVIEHHSNLDPDDQNDRDKLATENWDAPLILTTNVQIFESLYGNRVSACRKLHNLARSVIILDEAQALPVSLLEPCLEALRELVADYGATIVLCTATQPALNRRPQFPRGLENVREIMADPPSLFAELKRVEVKVVGKQSDAQIAEAISEHRRVLCIVNTRRHARALYDLVAGDGVFHLSALMCPAHRSRVIAEIRERLTMPDSVCRVVSTQLIEAGVDVDFPVVFRAMAGLDSIAQAAGRCNREGGSDCGLTFVFDGEKPPPAGLLRQTAQATEIILPRFKEYLLSLDAVRAYFERHYWTQAGRMDEPGILQRLREFDMKGLWIPFEDIARDFRMIRDQGSSVLIPHDNVARGLIATLRRTGPSGGLMRKLQRFSVNVYAQDIAKLGSAVEKIHERYFVLTRKDAYNPKTGLNVGVSEVFEPEALFVGGKEN